MTRRPFEADLVLLARNLLDRIENRQTIIAVFTNGLVIPQPISVAYPASTATGAFATREHGARNVGFLENARHPGHDRHGRSADISSSPKKGSFGLRWQQHQRH